MSETAWRQMWGDQMLSGAGVPDAPLSLDYLPVIRGLLPYNYWLMACGQWVAWLPMVLIVIGATAGLYFFKPDSASRQPDPAPLVIGAIAIAIFTATIVYQYLSIPLYGWGKASYMLSTTPCLAILAAAGFDLVGQNRLIRAAMGGLFLRGLCARISLSR